MTTPPRPSGTSPGPDQAPYGQEAVAALWRDVLGPEAGLPDRPLAPDDDFFALGATSLQAMTLVQRLEEEFGARIGLGALLEDATLGAVTGAVAAARQGADRA